MSDSPLSSLPRALRLDGTINAGHLLQVGTLLAALAVWLLAGRGKVDQTAAEVSDLKLQMASQASTTREQLAAQANGTRDSLREGLGRVEVSLAGVGQQLQTLPPLIERIRRIEMDIARLQEADSDLSTRIENRRNLIDSRVDALSNRVTEASTRLENLTRASGVNLPGSPGIRR